MQSHHDTERMEEVFEFVRKSEESALEAGRDWAKAMGEFLPMEMPVMRELVKGVFDLTEEVLKIQREFAHNMLMATRPMATRPMATRKSGMSARSAPRASRVAHAHRATHKVA